MDNFIQAWHAVVAAYWLALALARGNYELFEAVALIGSIGAMAVLVLLFWYGIEQTEDGR